ncbi:MAG: hypothetical protein KKF68_03205 [Nanoarchaeota archaeon]|nr:hypothetical protein [Nanoarchaeota archaeon]
MTIEDEQKKYALIDCTYFADCYEGTTAPYLCPSTKKDCVIFQSRLEKMLKQEETTQ